MLKKQYKVKMKKQQNKIFFKLFSDIVVVA